MIFIHHIFYAACICLSIGFLTSISVLSLFQALATIPLITYKIKYKLSHIPKSAYFLILYLLFSLISLFVNWYDLQEIPQAFSSLRHPIYSLLCLITFPFFIKNYLTPPKIKIITNLLLLSIIVSTFIGFIKYQFHFDLFHWEPITYPLFRNPGITGIMRYSYALSLLLSPLFFLTLNFKKEYKQYISFSLLFFALIIGVAGLITSQSRGAILAFLCTLPLSLFFKNKKWGKIGFVLLFFTLGIFAYNISLKKSSQSRIFQKFYSSSNLMRVALYETTFLSFKENPWLGLGPKQFSYHVKRIKEKNHLFWGDYCQKFQLNCDYSKRGPHYNVHAHNIFLEKLANLGFLGFMSFCLWLIFWFLEMTKRKDILGKMNLLFISNLFILGQFDYVLSGTIAFLIFYTYSLSQSFLHKK